MRVLLLNIMRADRPSRPRHLLFMRATGHLLLVPLPRPPTGRTGPGRQLSHPPHYLYSLPCRPPLSIRSVHAVRRYSREWTVGSARTRLAARHSPVLIAVSTTAIPSRPTKRITRRRHLRKLSDMPVGLLK